MYLLFAYVVLPVLVPAAVLAVEADAGRRRWLARFTVLGASVAAIYLLAMVRGPIGVAIEGHSLNYDTAVNAGGPLAVVYVAACCARSSSRVGGPSPSSAWPMWSQWPS